MGWGRVLKNRMSIPELLYNSANTPFGWAKYMVRKKEGKWGVRHCVRIPAAEVT